MEIDGNMKLCYLKNIEKEKSKELKKRRKTVVSKFLIHTIYQMKIKFAIVKIMLFILKMLPILVMF